ncbi:hypothetical protein [Mycolicibacterium sphagni]|uniref:hypothetical protein n=1 Tax=Mycolicibacterium sphagni TaxID=1786 RepID=UPI0021F32AD1|nr:hypothetical protein [Mycolicibacterium sphagni]MCV7174803.1 hypothetical protein [Mycolicibacterium sphagni]
MAIDIGEQVFVLEVHWGYDEDCDQLMYVRRSLHVQRDNAIKRVFDVIYEIAHVGPDKAFVTNSATNSDGGEFVEVTAGQPFEYNIVPHTIEE